MKPRHAAALALVGWYLMMPPVDPAWIDPTDARFKQDQLNWNAPLYQWWIADWRCNPKEKTPSSMHEWWIADWRFNTPAENFNTTIDTCDVFHTSDECNAAIPNMRLRPKDDWKGKAQCINSDDARLKGYPLKFVGEPE
jgi:hypothetical protein